MFELRPTNPTPDEFLASLARDPMKFIKVCWPKMKLSEKQREVLLSLCENIETFVHAANKTGKTWIAAVAILWWFASRTPARAIVSSSSESQLVSVLWSALKHLIATSAYPLPLKLTHLKIEKRKFADRDEVEALDYVIGIVPNAPESFQGHHLPNDRPRVLLVLDESSGIPDQLFEAAASWFHRALVMGNPLSNTGFFCRLCRGGDVPDPAGTAELLRKVIRISGKDSPNVAIGLQRRAAGLTGPSPILIPGH